MRRRLQESFHLSPSTANGGGFFSSLGGGHGGTNHQSHIPTISVSVQTEPSMVTMNGNGSLANTATMLAANGGLFQNGICANPNGIIGNMGNNLGNNYATLPHPHHMHHTMQAVVSTESETVGVNHNWSRDNLLAESYRDVRDAVLTTFPNGNPGNPGQTIGIHSRENTLSRDIHHITVLT
jgi:hypothetical protein